MVAKRTTVLELDELQKMLGMKGIFGRLTAHIAYGLLDLGKVNRGYAKYCQLEGPEFSKHILEHVGVSFDIPEEQLSRIPAQGGFITVSNHHYGSIDGMILSAVVGSRRSDYKILTTYFLTLLESLKDSFIPVDNFSSGGARSISGIRTALTHLADGKPLGLFPAGEVATWQKGKNRTALRKGKVVEDIPWADNVVKLIQKSGFPVIPIYFDGGNSRMFHLLGRIHPRLRTVRLVHEMFNKSGTTVKVRIGQPVQAADIANMDIPLLGRYLRNRCYALEAECQPAPEKGEAVSLAPLAEPVPQERIFAELNGLEDRQLFEVGDYKAYLLRADEAPAVMQELYRLREETFRAVGEGTGKPFDTDQYDAYYRQMILWNVPNRELVGAYRLGFGPEICSNYGGVSGFYTASLIKYGEKAAPLLGRSLELGRSFIVQKYQREVHPLRLLLTGLTVCTMKFPEIEYCSGPVSISNDFPHFYKSIIVRYLSKNYPFADAEQVAEPAHPFEPDYLRVNPDDLLRPTDGNIDLFDRLLSALSDGKYRLPVLVRKYFSCGARIVLFNVDPDFSNCLDGLIFLKLSDFPQNTLRSILRGLPDDLQDKVWLHFYGTPRS